MFRTNGNSLEVYRLTISLAHKLAAIRRLFAKVDASWPKYYSLSVATVDEILPAFRGKCSFMFYMPSNRNRYGRGQYVLLCKSASYLNFDIIETAIFFSRYIGKVKGENVKELSHNDGKEEFYEKQGLGSKVKAVV